MNIGNWIRRGRGKWHLVESVVAEDAVTRCGRRMDRRMVGGKLQVSEVMPLTRLPEQPQLCKAGCQREERVAVTGGIQVVEDDASTQPELVP